MSTMKQAEEENQDNDEDLYTCCSCGNLEEPEYQHKFLVVLNADESGIERTGIYQIKDFPYYISSYFDMYLIPESLERIADIPKEIDSDYSYPCGHLCLDCQKQFNIKERKNDKKKDRR